MDEIKLKEYSRDIEYIKELLKLWENTNTQYKSNILYEFYFYKNKFEDLIEYNKEYNLADSLIIEELKVVLHALNILIDSLTNTEVKQIYEGRNKEKSKTKKIDKLKYGRSEEQKFSGYIKRTENKITQKSVIELYYKRIITKIIIAGICIFLLLTGLPGRITDSLSQTMYNIQYDQEIKEAQEIKENITNIANEEKAIIVFIVNIATIFFATGICLKVVIDLFIIIHPNILSLIGFKETSKIIDMPDDLKVAIELSEDSKHEVEVETEIKKLDKLLMIDELVETLKNNYKEHKEILNNLRCLSVGLKSKKYKDRYNSSSKIENYYNYLLKTENNIG